MMTKMRIVALVITSPIWIPSGLLFAAFCVPLVLLGGLMGLISYAFGWDV